MHHPACFDLATAPTEAERPFSNDTLGAVTLTVFARTPVMDGGISDRAFDCDLVFLTGDLVVMIRLFHTKSQLNSQNVHN